METVKAGVLETVGDGNREVLLTIVDLLKKQNELLSEIAHDASLARKLREAGKKSAEARLKKYGTANPEAFGKKKKRRVPEPVPSAPPWEKGALINEGLSKASLLSNPGELPVEEPLKPSVTTGSSIWAAYAEAFQEAYGQPALRNARANSMCKQLLVRLGCDGPAVARFYLSHQDRFYLRSRHDLALLVRDAEKLHLEWRTGDRSTDVGMRDVENAAFSRNQLGRIERGEL